MKECKGGEGMRPIVRIVEEVIERRKQPLKFAQSVKPPPRGKYWSNLWSVFSPKINRYLTLYSDLEYHYWIKIESNTDIAGFCEQPISAKGWFEGKEGESILDFWILNMNGREEYWETKYSENLVDVDAKHEVKKQLTIQKQWANKYNLFYYIKKEYELLDDVVLLDNWSKILLSITHSRNIDLKNQMVQMLDDLVITKRLSLQGLAADFTHDEGFAVIGNLLHLGLIELNNPHTRLNWKSEVTLSHLFQG